MGLATLATWFPLTPIESSNEHPNRLCIAFRKLTGTYGRQDAVSLKESSREGMKASGEIAPYLSVLAVSPWRRDRRRARQIVPLGRKWRPRLRRQIGQDPPPHVILSFRVLVVHVVAGLAVIPVANVATGEHVLGAAQCALVRDARCRGLLCLRSGRKFDDLVVWVTTVSGERRWRGFRRGRWPALLLLLRFLLLLRLLHGERNVQGYT